ncbi:MAG: VOC family protein [Phycisphaerales bacterium]|nr:VOC family protein [Phycisphaerales bacterium]MCI0630947.1 VOC family protein [Phycisphaerales bacterium]MCI0675064.1 VOC family protein [Phycisphaerales bacterium]
MPTQTPHRTSASFIHGGSPTIFISNMDRAVRFYTEILGLKIAYRAGNEFCMIDAGGGLSLGLHPYTAGKSRTPKPGTPGSIQVGLNVTQPIEEVYETLRQRGVNFHGPVVNDDSVKLAFFNDPDGNELYLCEVMH